MKKGMRFRRSAGFLLVLIGLALLIFWGVLTATERVGTDAQLYRALQVRAGALETAGISEPDLILADEGLAQCLKGDASALDALPEISIDGVIRAAFNDREKTHMEDCRRLFDLLRRVKAWLLASPLLVALGVVLLNDRKRLKIAAWLAPATVLLPLGAFGAWAAADFDSAFTFFHHLLFTNDLWLLNPETDLLIRICPEQMFMWMGLMIAGLSLLWMALLPLMVTSASRWVEKLKAGR